MSAASGEPIAARPGLPVLFMSGYAEELLADSSPGAEGVNIHDKPCTVARLSAAVREAMNPQR